MIDLRIFGSVFNSLYADTLTVYRHSTSLNADGTTATNLTKVAVHENIPCRLSFGSSNDSPNDTDINKSPISIIPKIFCSTDIDIKSGDFIIVTRLNKAIYQGIVGRANIYETHQEILLSVEGDS